MSGVGFEAVSLSLSTRGHSGRQQLEGAGAQLHFLLSSNLRFAYWGLSEAGGAACQSDAHLAARLCTSYFNYGKTSRGGKRGRGGEGGGCFLLEGEEKRSEKRSVGVGHTHTQESRRIQKEVGG